jgi:DNA-binding response OmpR family regulator
MLQNARILITEDDEMIGFFIAEAVKEAGGIPVGPIATQARAYQTALSSEIHGAILDVKLRDGDCTPTAAELASRKCPVIVSSGRDVPADLLRYFPQIVTMPKPVVARVLVARLVELLQPDPSNNRHSGHQ